MNNIKYAGLFLLSFNISNSIAAQEEINKAEVHDGSLAHPYTIVDCASASTCPAGVYRFTPQDDITKIQTTLDAIYALMSGDTQAVATYSPAAEWSTNRFALLFDPGTYDVSVRVNYYTQILGLGASVEDVNLSQLYVDNLCQKGKPNTCLTLGALNNFWRGVENLTFNPKTCRIAPSSEGNSEFKNSKCVTWNVSQAAPMRNVTINGDLMLSAAGCFNNQGQCNGPAGSGGDKPCTGTYQTDFVCGAGYASGGFMANVKVNGTIHSISQQQWFTRNSNFNLWAGGVWNMVFLNTTGALPTQSPNTDAHFQDLTNWPVFPITNIQNTSVDVQEKPYLIYKNEVLQVFIPGKNMAYPVNDLVVLNKNNQDINKINQALAVKPGLVIEPGVYDLNAPINVPSDKFVLGLGIPLLTCVNGTSCFEVSGKNAIVAGLMVGAGYKESPALVHVSGQDKASSSQEKTTLADIFCRIGESNVTRKDSGPTATTCITIDADYTLGDNLWLWRADHDRASSQTQDVISNLVTWSQNISHHGLVVNGNNVTMLGLFSEHHQGSNVLWKGQSGSTYFYQSELPYDAPTNWQCEDFASTALIGGCPGYLIDKNVTAHSAAGLGIYTFFQNNVMVPAAVISPAASSISINHLVARYLNGPPAPITSSGFKCLIKSLDDKDSPCFGAEVNSTTPLTAIGLWQSVPNT